MSNVFIRPRRDAEGKPMVVPDPQTFAHLPAEGAWKSLDQPYWPRRIAQGDVEVCEPPAP